MPSKTEEYLALAQRTANGLTRYWESWTAYLTTASRLYKYPFADQLMIYAQRPDATACADYPTLTELEQTAVAMKEHLMTELLAKNPAPDKEKNQMQWVQHMNSLREQVEEVIRTELIYS